MTLNTVNKRFFKLMIFTAIFIWLFGVFDPAGRIRVQAAEMTDIRIGLADLYKDKSSIMIYNSRIGLGFCVNNTYSAEIELESSTGFSVTPDKGTYYEDVNNFSSYSTVLRVCENYKNAGAAAFPVYAGNSCWKCYVTAASYNNLAESRDKDLIRDLVKKNNNPYLIRIAGRDITLLADGEAAGGFPQIKAMNPTNGIYSVNLGTRSYRGRIEIGRYNRSSTLTAVNILNIESYLLGVVTCEMQKTWPKEALKAQAICSRSYAYLRCGFGADSNLKNPYSVVDTTASQVYRGVGGESPESLEAVNSTKKQIVLYKNKPIDAFFFSTSGGATDSIMDIWGIKSPAYIGVADIYERDPEKKPWIYDFTIEEATQKILDAGYEIGRLKALEPIITTDSGRVYKVRIKGTDRSVTVSGSKLRSIFGLSDTKLRIITGSSDADRVFLKSAGDTGSVRLKDCYAITADGTVKLPENAGQYILISERNLYNIPASVPADGIIRIIGMGWGHGVGMSQSGAMGMAQKGFDHREIIAFYFNNAEIGEY